MAEHTAAQFPLVVGFDGSEGSRRALAWTTDEARPRSAKLEVVRAWTPGEFGTNEEMGTLTAEAPRGGSGIQSRAASLKGFAILGLTVEDRSQLERWVVEVDRAGIAGVHSRKDIWATTSTFPIRMES